MKARRAMMPGPAHHQGSYGLPQYKEAWKEAHGQQISNMSAYSYAHAGKAKLCTPFDPTNEDALISNTTVKEKIRRYNEVSKQKHGKDYNPMEHDIDGEVVMIAGQGKKHGRHWIGDAVLDTASTPTLTKIRARSTGSSPAIQSRPSAAMMQMEALNAQLEEEKRINAERDQQRELEKQHLMREHRELAERQRAMEEWMMSLAAASGHALPPLPPPTQLMAPAPPPSAPGLHTSGVESNSPGQRAGRQPSPRVQQPSPGASSGAFPSPPYRHT